MRLALAHARLVSCFLFLLVPTVAGRSNGAPFPAASGKSAAWTVEDMVAAEHGDGFQISPDGRWAVWVKHTPDHAKDEMVSNLVLTSLTDRQEITLTRGPNHEQNPKWSRDGRLIAFLSERAAPRPSGKEADAEAPPEPPKTQVWLLDTRGGEPWPLTQLERSVKDFDWVDAETLLIVAEEGPTLYERMLKDQKDDSRAVEDAEHTPPLRLFKVNVRTGDITRFTTNRDWIESVTVSPDGRHAVAIHQRSLSYEFDEKVRPVAFLYDLATGQGRAIFPEGLVTPWAGEYGQQKRWTQDSNAFYLASLYSTHPVYRQAYVVQLYYYDLAADKAVKVDLGWANELGLDADPAFTITPDGFVALLADGAHFKAARFTREGFTWKRAWLEGEDAGRLQAVKASDDGKTLIYLASGASRPEQWFRARLEGNQFSGGAPITELNPAFSKKTAARAEVVRWKGALGEEVEGLLYYPQNYEAGKKYPLVLMIHGGPLGADLDAWDDRTSTPTNLYTQRGAFVLKPNYHGSSNYGLKWAESIGGGKYYDLEVPDIEAGVDALIARGLVDADRLGALGWSNGAILTIALTLHSTRYKAASAGAGDVEQASDWAYATFGAAFDNYYLGAAPYDDPQLYIRKSPFFESRRFKTPTIVFSGTDDRDVGHAQAWEHFRALQQIGQADVRFVPFPGEPHGLKKLSHRRRKVEEELAWFDQYLFKPGPRGNEAVKDDSPLAQALDWRRVKKAGTDFGVLVKSTLVPEVVAYEGVRLGRFEVTRAQYAAFDKNYRIEPGTENYPASGVSFAEAQAYCAWLSKLTGENYRLGKVEELEPIYRDARANENTLDYWAGYPVNPEDAVRLQVKVKELAGSAPLLKPVGSFPGRGTDERVFDLGGNVAEWAVDRTGKGKALGGSADQPADPKTSDSGAAPAYVGFRVMK